MRVLAIIWMFWATAALADELPNNLLLKCEGKVSFTIDGVADTPSNVDKFETTLRLKDGELADTDAMWMSTKGCALTNGIVHCSLKLIVPSDFNNGSERRSLETYLDRSTGEYNLFLESWDYDQPNARGHFSAHMRLRRNGVCQVVSKPLF